MNNPAAWLADAVVYEIYPQSFADTDGDGIGDLPGVLEHLDHLQWLGVDAIWFNPCFASPFRDAGYDVSDYLTIAPRYGTNDDMVAVVDAARERGIRVLLDLVAGHTSIEHPWFQASAQDPDDDRYIWTDRPGELFVPSPGKRPGWYLKNFFPEQPALNFGYARLDPDEPWRQLPDAPGPRRNREALQEIIGFWLDRGVAGFRVDMAYSLVKDDADFVETTALWREIRDWMHEHYPHAVLLPESDADSRPDVGVRGGFDADFALVIHREHSALFNNGGAGRLPWQPGPEACYFDADVSVREGTAALQGFLALWDARLAEAGQDRLVILSSADHDYSRLASGTRTGDQLRPAFTFLLTWGSVPSIYYGDEIGMRNLDGLPDREGSVWSPLFNRAGCRTPMQWDRDQPNDGFSSAPADALYLPQDADPDRPTVQDQLDDDGSLLHFVRSLVELRRAAPALRAGADHRVLAAGYPFVYVRGGRHLVVVNPHRDVREVAVGELAGVGARSLLGSGVTVSADGVVRVEGFGHGVLELDRVLEP